MEKKGNKMKGTEESLLCMLPVFKHRGITKQCYKSLLLNRMYTVFLWDPVYNTILYAEYLMHLMVRSHEATLIRMIEYRELLKGK